MIFNVGSGSGGDGKSVKYTAQTLTNNQKRQARTNIGAASKYSPATEDNVVTLTEDGDINDSGRPIDSIPYLYAGTSDMSEGDPLTAGIFYAVYEGGTT